jgi:hypothetical protein
MTIHLPWRRSRVTAIACAYCGTLRKPRQIRLPAVICRDCEAAGFNQTWQPSRRHLARALALHAREETARRQALRENYGRDDITLAGRR